MLLTGQYESIFFLIQEKVVLYVEDFEREIHKMSLKCVYEAVLEEINQTLLDLMGNFNFRYLSKLSNKTQEQTNLIFTI